MGWELRGNRCYAYAKLRRGRSVVSVYLGRFGERAGAVVEAHRREAEERKRNWEEARRVEAARWETSRAELDALDAQIARLSRIADSAFRETMVAAGCHLHKRQWRRRRGVTESKMNSGLPDRPLGHHISFALRETLVKRFVGRRPLAQAPFDPSLWLDPLNLMEHWYVELAGDNPTPVEEVLIERVVICRFNAYLADLDVEQNIGSLYPMQLAGLEKRRTACHRRLLSAVKALETVRRLALRKAKPACAPTNRLAGLLN
jgi:hypothetical protein